MLLGHPDVAEFDELACVLCCVSKYTSAATHATITVFLTYYGSILFPVRNTVIVQYLDDNRKGIQPVKSRAAD